MRLYTLAFSMFVFLIFCSSAKTQSNPNICFQVDKVIQRLGQIHFSPVSFDAEVKKQIVALYINEIDSRNYFFSKEDLETLQANAASDGLCSSYKLSRQLYDKRVKAFDSLARVYLSKPVKFIKGETIAYNASTSSHLRSAHTAINTYREKVLRFKILSMIYNQVMDDSLNFKTEKDLTPALEKELREKLATREKVYFERLINNRSSTDKRLEENFLNSIALRFDPHSNFFSGADKEEFEEGLSKEKKTFGFSLMENKEFEIEIAEVLPGSSAWNSNQIYEDDIIESITDTRGHTYDLMNRGMDYVSKLLKDPMNNELTFNIRSKANGKLSVKLVKAEVDNVENAFTGYLMTDDKIKLGYIPLPSFYTDFESDAQLGCANDVAKEILLLKKDGIQGLIIDLRNNGGGSIKEAIEISGLFIDEGPMSVFKPKVGKPYLLKDMNRGTVYDGPIIILVNNLSASASEFVAGCLQSYGRALIVGDITYGKGTAQAIYPVDTILTAGAAKNGYLKITDGKFYHVSRRSNQEKGVVPEIIIPDIYSGMDFYKEKNQLYHLDNDTVAKKVTIVRSAATFNGDMIQKSKARIAVSAEFGEIKSLSDSLKTFMQDDQAISLELMPYFKYASRTDAFMDRIADSYDHKQEGFKIANHSFASQLLELDAAEKEFNESVIEDLQFDPIIAESFWILKDFISFGK